jgi:hypothetical protein
MRAPGNEDARSARSLRFGVMLDGPAVLEWQSRCIRELLETEGVELALLIFNERRPAPPNRRRLPGARVDRALYSLYRRHLLKPASRARVGMEDVFEGAPSVSCRVTLKGKFSQYFSPEDVSLIRSHNLDFILRFGFNIIRGEMLGAARYGVWSFHHDDEEKYRGGPPCFWEIYNRDPVTGAVLQRLTDRLDGGVVLKKGYFKTVDHSYAGNLDSVFLEAAKWPALVCRDIRLGVAPYLDAAPSRTSAPIYHNPNNLQMLLFLRTIIANTLRRASVGLLRRAKWNVGVVRAPVHSFLTPGYRPAIEWLPAPARGAFLADPFAVQKGGALHLFVEEFSYRENRAVISHVELGEGRKPSRPRPVLAPAVHLSYPCTFEHGGAVYCVPESFQAREVALYEAVRFPHGWRKKAILLDGVAGVDATVFEHEGRWWLLCGVADRNAYVHLYAWYAPDLTGPYVPHAANPVKTDVRSSRPAGMPFTHEGQLYRPAQDCSSSYGGRVVINRVLKLTPTEFREEPAATVGPDPGGPYPDGVHTVSAVGNMTVVDGKRDIFVRVAFQRTLARQLVKVYSRMPVQRLRRAGARHTEGGGRS